MKGKNLSFYHFQAGDLIGQLDDSEKNLSSFTAETVTACTVDVIRRSDLENQIRKSGDLAIDFMRWLSFMNRFTQNKTPGFDVLWEKWRIGVDIDPDCQYVRCI